MNRRDILAGLTAVAIMPRVARAKGFVDLAWTDLVPVGTTPPAPVFEGLIDHTIAPLSAQQPPSSGLRADWNGQTVRLPGFVVPLDHSGTGITSFILVPFVGACVHVPPPPANQLVLVTTDRPFQSAGLYEAVHVTGALGVSTIHTHLAEVGYSLAAQNVKPFSG